MSFDPTGDPPDFKKILEMITKQIENMPPPFGPMLKDMVKKLENFSQEQLNDMFHNLLNGESGININDMLGEDFAKGSFNIFNLSTNPDFFSKLQDMIKNPSNVNVNVTKLDYEEPYYEFMDNVENTGGNLLIELPGINDIRFINWKIQDGNFMLSTSNDGSKYRLDIGLTRPLKLQDTSAELKNNVLTIPFEYQ